MSGCHGSASADPVSTTRVLLVGNPNVGKSTLFNALTGARQSVMNAPGTTVELRVGHWRAAGVDVTDLPGTYSIVARSPDEQVVADALDAAPQTAVVVLLDATALSRSLYLLAQVGGDRRVVVGLTMLDVAVRRGHAVDVSLLAELLDVPVVPLDPRAGRGLAELAAALPAARPVRSAPRETRVSGGAARPHRTGPPGGDQAGRVVAGRAGPGHNGNDADGDARLDAASRLFEWVAAIVQALGAPPPPRATVTDAVDRALLTPWVGVPVFVGVLWALFQLTTAVAAPVMDLADTTVAALSAPLRVALAPAGPWVQGLVVDGVLVGVGMVLTFLPLLAILYLALGLLEDSGYLARVAFVADRLMRAVGLDGRAMLPLVIGFGCNVPGVAATQTLPHARQRLLTGMLVPWTSCAARLPVYVLLAAVFFPEHAGAAVVGMYVLSLLLVIGGGLLLRRTLFRDLGPEPLLLVLPPYQRPSPRTILLSVWVRVRAFATRASGIIVTTLTVVWLLTALPAGDGEPLDVPVEDSVYGSVAQHVAPVFAPAGFGDWHMSAALATGFVAKEVVVGALAQSYAVEDGGEPPAAQLRETLEESSGGHGAAAAFAFMVFVLGYTPCLATVAEQWRRFGPRWTAGTVALQMSAAWVLAVVVFQVGALLGRLL